MLNARGQFAAYMWAPALANVVAIGGLVWFGAAYGANIKVDDWTGAMVWILAGTATLGVAAQALALWFPLRRSGFRYRPVWGFRGVGLRSASTVALLDLRGGGGQPARVHRHLEGDDQGR